MRYGFTTGSCAAAAAKAAAYMLLMGKAKTEITIETPKGILYRAKILDITRREDSVSCGVEKDGGDDPDVTTGTRIYARVSLVKDRNAAGRAGGDPQSEVNDPQPEEHNRQAEVNDSQSEEHNRQSDGGLRLPAKDGLPAGENRQEVYIDGGIGIGRVTKPGLDQPVGNAAINRVPREMIRKEVMEVCRIADYRGGLLVEISAPEGERLAAQTFNPRLGIVGGISILGTSGIVEPMSSQAVLDTIRVELNQRRAQGFDYAAVTPGNYGQEFMKRAYGYDLERSVKCSNFIGETVDIAVELGFSRILLTGHVGKLIKVAGGIMNTHSREADCRMELLAAFAIREGAEPEQCLRIMDCVTTEEAAAVLVESGKLCQVMEHAAERICYYLEKRSGGRLRIDCVLYSNEYGELARSKGVAEWFTLLAQDAGRQI